MPSFIIRPFVALITLTIGIALAALPSAFRFNHSSSSADQQEVLRVEREYLNAHINRDTAALERLLADDFTINAPYGRTVTRMQRLAMLADPDFTFSSIESNDANISVDGDRATTSGQAVVRGRMLDQDFVSRPYHFVRTFERRDGRWQVVSVRATRLGWW